MSAFFELRPEVAGQLGEDTTLDTTVHPPHVTFLHYEFDGWLGDDLLESFPCYVVTKRLEKALKSAGVGGCSFDLVEVTKSDLFEDLHPNFTLPDFSWLQVQGAAGVDDFGLSNDHILVVSESVLTILRSFVFNHCSVEPYRP